MYCLLDASEALEEVLPRSVAGTEVRFPGADPILGGPLNVFGVWEIGVGA